MHDHLDFVVVGTGRSGTTLTRAILQGHSRIAIPGETGFVPNLMRASTIWWRQGHLQVQLFTRLAFANGRLARAGYLPAELAGSLRSTPPPTPMAAIGRIYGLHARKHGADTVGDKTPGYVRQLDLLDSWFPGLRVIRMVRHPLDVVASLCQQPWAPRSPLACAELWLTDQEAFAASRLSGSALTLRLEDLIAEPEQLARAMAEHLGQGFEPAMLQYRDRAEDVMGENVHPEAHAGLKGELGGRRNWRDQLSRDEAAYAWSIVREPAELLGYVGPEVRAVPPAEQLRRRARFEGRVFAFRRRWRSVRSAARVLIP